MKQSKEQWMKWARLARRDPGELWMDESIDAYTLVRLDRMDITLDMIRVAEHPELENPWIRRLPEEPVV